ncbi:MAG TPA: ABC transporter substrate-binding protein, partial [Acidimicrobiales bacterium]|nr:ABC transporter substrate-binding protein [Acidimicrobiales bacterium]
MMRRTVGIVVGTVMALVVAACSSPDDSGSTTPAPPEGVLRLAVETPGSLDPAQARSPSEFLLVDQLFDGLTAYDSQTLAVKPALAASWQPTPDFRHWDFTLRPGAVFANGRPITSADVKYTLERIARQGSTSPAVAQLELVAGFKPFNITGKAPDLAGVATPAPNIVRIDLDEPLAQLPAVLGNPTFGIVPRESVEAIPPAPAFARQPVGSGPFIMRSRTDFELNLVPAPGTQTSLKAIDVFLAKDSSSAY